MAGSSNRASTSLIAKRDGLPQPGAARVSDDYRSLLGLASHEYFHTWNVKRITPAAFVPYDLTRENFTTQLWAFEGITSYYDDLMLVRGKVIDVADYLELVGRQISALLRTPGRERQSVAESSFDAWIKYYRQDENAPNAIVSYYVKGALIALALDLELRLGRTDARRRHASTMATSRSDRGRRARRRRPDDRGRAFRARSSRVFLRLCVRHGRVAAAFATAGIRHRLELRPAANAKDKGGVPGKEPATRVWLGATLAAGANLRLNHLTPDGPAALAGLASGDAIVAIDGVRATVDGLERLARTMSRRRRRDPRLPA